MKTTLLTSLTICLVSVVHAEADVTVYQRNNSEKLTITGVQRLADVVTQPALAKTWWPGAVISERQASAAIVEQHQRLLAALGQLASERGGTTGAALSRLRQQLLALKVTGRQLVNIDPDWIRVRQEANRPLEGDYQLWAGPRPSSVTLFGLIDRPGNVPFSPGRSVTDYLSGINLLSGADRSYAWVVYPNGETERAPVAYWNRRDIEPMPGSVIFVGLAGSRFSHAPDELNTQILHSLTHRIPD